MQLMWSSSLRRAAGRVGIMVVVAALVAGCDPQPKPAPVADADHPAKAAPASAPSTQATRPSVLDEPRKKFELGDCPLTMSVPKSWNFGEHGVGIIGEAPSGLIVLTVSAPTFDPGLLHGADPKLLNVTPEQLELIEKKAKDDKGKPGVLLSDVRTVGRVRVVEKRTVVAVPASRPSAPGKDDGVPAGDRVDWSLSVYEPIERGTHFKRYVLTFIGLSRAEYDQDRAFLEEIVGSMEYNPMAGGDALDRGVP